MQTTLGWGRTLKYEEVYLHAYDTVSAATAGLDRYLTLYNFRRPHSSLADRTPDEAYFHSLSLFSRAMRYNRVEGQPQESPGEYRTRITSPRA